MGDPTGVGPELALKSLSSTKIKKIAEPIIVGDLGLLNYLAKKLKIKAPRDDQVISLSNLNINSLKSGRPTKASSKAMIDYITYGVELVASGGGQAIVTAPISKAAAKLSGFKFPGHTEYIAHLTDTKKPIMMLGGSSLKVVLVTIHVAIKSVPKLITEDKILETIKITNKALKKSFNIKSPRIAVAGLNPHSGEGGLFGEEENTEIIPAIKKARRAKINASGPYPADTVFYRARKGEFDVVVCMYHDQGLGPLKLIHFDDGVNVTLGLPIIRTSPDHGTAYDIAWTGKAKTDSMFYAIETAVNMAKQQNKK